MKSIRFHALGQKEYLKSLKTKYDQLIEEVKINPKLSAEEKENAVRVLKEKYRKDTENSSYHVFSSR